MWYKFINYENICRKIKKMKKGKRKNVMVINKILNIKILTTG